MKFLPVACTRNALYFYHSAQDKMLAFRAMDAARSKSTHILSKYLKLNIEVPMLRVSENRELLESGYVTLDDTIGKDVAVTGILYRDVSGEEAEFSFIESPHICHPDKRWKEGQHEYTLTVTFFDYQIHFTFNHEKATIFATAVLRKHETDEEIIVQEVLGFKVRAARIGTVKTSFFPVEITPPIMEAALNG